MFLFEIYFDYCNPSSFNVDDILIQNNTVIYICINHSVDGYMADPMSNGNIHGKISLS